MGSKKLGIVTALVVVLSIGAMMFWQFSQPPFLRKAGMNTELAEELDAELKKLEFIQVLNRDVIFTNKKLNNQTLALFQAVLPLDTTISQENLRTVIIDHLKGNLNFPYKEDIYEVYEIIIVQD